MGTFELKPLNLVIWAYDFCHFLIKKGSHGDTGNNKYSKK